MATSSKLMVVLLVLWSLFSLGVYKPINDVPVAPVISYEEVYSQNTRVLQWKHYFEEVKDLNSDARKRGREFYLNTILREFAKVKVPKERAEIYAHSPEIESAWRTSANSPAGAKGLWQVMDNTAKRFGYEPRQMYDPVLATRCAVQYIAFLDSLYNGDPAAVLFAYNGGEGTVNLGMKTYATDNVWNIDFKSRETYDFAPKIIGAWLALKED